MGDVVDFQTGSEVLRLTEEEEEILKWEPLAVALYQAIKRLKKKFGADDMVMIQVLQVLLEGFMSDLESDLKYEDAGDGDDDAA